MVVVLVVIDIFLIVTRKIGGFEKYIKSNDLLPEVLLKGPTKTAFLSRKTLGEERALSCSPLSTWVATKFRVRQKANTWKR
jgi:hypothetical protein